MSLTLLTYYLVHLTSLFLFNCSICFPFYHCCSIYLPYLRVQAHSFASSFENIQRLSVVIKTKIPSCVSKSPTCFLVLLLLCFYRKQEHMLEASLFLCAVLHFPASSFAHVSPQAALTFLYASLFLKALIKCVLLYTDVYMFTDLNLSFFCQVFQCLF